MPIPTVDISPSIPLVILDSDNEDSGSEMSSCPYQGNFSENTGDDIHKNDTMECDNAGHQTLLGGATLCSGNEKKKDSGVFVGVKDEENEQPDDDGVDDVWKEMSFVLEYSKDTTVDLLYEDRAIKDREEDCDHFFILKDDVGTVCRICGYIEKSIETIIDLQFGKVSLALFVVK
ncbi:PREDICTED: protein CHROMATIN REMODELING 35-like [Ipomoea nil]|uniref:protein CHROMATIN REMODELING 35-like n=1 Tax=Ipomoea nil TaxID=35883 RepID=UPI000900BDD5|nr:PREDICTED: protein CHROMATIN REMODELING 35-like [Ipomoea nil]